MIDRYRFIEHTADLGLEVESSTLAGVYETAGRALFDLVAPGAGSAEIPFSVESEGGDRVELLVNFLNDLLFHFEVEGLLFRTFETQRLGGARLVMEARAEPLEGREDRVHTVVKAATHHRAEVERKGKGWRAVVFFDL